MEESNQVNAECISCSLSSREDRQILITPRIKSAFFYTALLQNHIQAVSQLDFGNQSGGERAKRHKLSGPSPYIAPVLGLKWGIFSK